MIEAIAGVFESVKEVGATAKDLPKFSQGLNPSTSSFEQANLPINNRRDYLSDDNSNINELADADATNNVSAEHTEYNTRNLGAYGTENKIENSRFVGGRFGDISRDYECEIHHMPADSASYLERNDGPAIQMDKADHRQTASCGSSKEAQDYRQIQKDLIDSDKFEEAVQMDIDDIRSKFGEKYDGAIDEMFRYIDELKGKGVLR